MSGDGDTAPRAEVRTWFGRFLEAEAEAIAYVPGSRPAGAPPWAEG